MKRFIATALVGPDDKPLFDLVIYGASLSEASQDEDSLTATLEVKLRKRNLTLEDFSGFRFRAADIVPRACAQHEYVDKLRVRR